jgi:hypothetical protein
VYSTKEEIGDYGEKKVIEHFDKTALCNKLCGENALAEHFENFRPILDEIQAILSA